MKRGYAIFAGLGLAVLASGLWWWLASGNAPAPQYKSANIERGNLQASISASGVVNPVTQVSVGTQVSGQIKELWVDFNSEVKAGQLMAQIDPETFEFRVRQAQADVDAALAQVLTAQANVLASNAAISRSQVDVQEARRDFERKKELADKQFIARSEADKAQAVLNNAGENVKSAQAQLAVTNAQVKSAQAIVAQRTAALSQARIDLQRTRITSPVNGMVIKRSIERGQTVAASLQAPELFVIAQNLSDMQVEASIDEADVSRIRTGQRATFSVDAFPGQSFEAVVKQVRKAAQNVANVVTYVAVLGFSNEGGRLLPGMTANVRVVTDSRENVLKIPNAALRVRIEGQEPTAPRSTENAPQSIASSQDNARASGQKGSQNSAAGAAQEGAGQAAIATGQGDGGSLAELRQRLSAELQLGTDQQQKLDALLTEIRPKFASLRDATPEDRPKVRERIMGELRAKINDFLTPEQKAKYTALQAEQGSRSVVRGRIFLLNAKGEPTAHQVRLGISDGAFTELIVLPHSAPSELFREGTAVIVGVSSGARHARPSGGPRMPF